MKKIPLRNKEGDTIQYSIVDDVDFETLSSYKWHLNKRGYPACIKLGTMHRVIAGFIFGEIDGKLVDHKNRDRLDNRRYNLRLADYRQNALNTDRKGRNKYSIYKGIEFDYRQNTWSVRIKTGKERLWIGSYKDEKDAALVHDYYGRLYGEEFFVPNFPDIYGNELETKVISIQKSSARRASKTSRFKGVYYDKNLKKYAAYVYYQPGKKCRAGVYDNEISAALAYNKRALKIFGEKAELNIIDQ